MKNEKELHDTTRLIDFALVKMAKDEKAASICRENAKIETDVVKRAIWSELASGFCTGGDAGREAVRWLIEWSEKIWLNHNNSDEIRSDAAYIRRLYP